MAVEEVVDGSGSGSSKRKLSPWHQMSQQTNMRKQHFLPPKVGSLHAIKTHDDNMADEERPVKMRKLSHVIDSPDAASGTAYVADLNGETTGQNSLRDTDHSNGVDEEDSDPIGETLSANAVPLPDEITSIDRSALSNADAPISKNQLKKLRKKQEWESKREERKLIKKEKLTAKRERKREVKQQEAAANGVDLSKPIERPKQAPAQRAVTLPVTILIDCDFDDLMRDNERISLASQITRCYSDNKNTLYRAHLAVCSFGGELRKRFDNVLTHYRGWRGVRFLDENFVDAAEQAKSWMGLTADSEVPAEETGKLAGSFAPYSLTTSIAQLQDEAEIVYLSSESDYTLHTLKPFSTYIIGGLVDKNREKGICYKRATRAGIKTAKLPIGEYLEMSSRKVLATNHVNEIMLEWLRCGDWGEAFVKVVPKRKGGQLRVAGDADGVEGAEDEDGRAGVDNGADLNDGVDVKDGADGADGVDEGNGADSVDERSAAGAMEADRVPA